MLQEHLGTSQLCSVPGTPIIEAVLTVGEAVTQAKVTDTPLCVHTLDFQEAFDGISHKFIFTILQRYGISPWFIERLNDPYEKATVLVQTNGDVAGPITFQCAIRQGCPQSMLLYALCLQPYSACW
jgi:hypothetical protein